MDSLSRVIAIAVYPGELIPCIRINKGIYTASTVSNTPFKIEIQLTYTSGGANVGPISSVQTVSTTQFMQELDAHTIRAKGQAIAIPSLPDLRTPVVLAVRVLINDASGIPVECWSADVASFPATAVITPSSSATGGAAGGGGHDHGHGHG